MEIRFKATRSKHDSGFAFMEKEGDMRFDMTASSGDVIILYLKDGSGSVRIDCDYKTKQFRVFAEDELFRTYEH